MLVDLAFELEGEADERGFAAAREAEAMARRLGDPHLLTMALNAAVLEHFWPGGHDERRRIGRELLRVADESHLVPARVLGHMTLAQTGAADGDLASADHHVAEVEALAETYEQPLTAAIASWYHGLRHVVAGDLDAALAAYGEADRRMREVRMWEGAEDTLTVATACAWLAVGRLGELAARWDAAPRLDPELHALGLAHAGRLAEAREVAGRAAPIRRDYAMDLRWAVRGLLGVALDDPDRVADAHRELLPHSSLLAAAGSGVLVVAPVAEVLGDLAAHRGDRGAAARHYRQAVVVAERAGAAHWAARASAAARAAAQ
jgi:hypothetical protein